MSRDLPNETDLTPYNALKVIGEGGTGRVYLAHRIGSTKPVALKVFHASFMGQAGGASLAVKHATMLRKLGHPSIVAFLEAGTLQDGSLFVAMEHLVGRDLGEALAREEALDYTRVLRLAVQTCDALHAAHGIGIVHRDLKPNNVFLVEDAHNREQVKLLDFAPQAMDSTARADLRLGIPEYWSPEQACGRPLDPRSDIYTLGVVMYEAMTGILPFRSHSYSDIIAQHIHTEPAQIAAPASQRPIPEAVQDLVLRCLRKNPADRFQSAAELREAALQTGETAVSAPVQPSARTPKPSKTRNSIGPRTPTPTPTPTSSLSDDAKAAGSHASAAHPRRPHRSRKRRRRKNRLVPVMLVAAAVVLALTAAAYRAVLGNGGNGGDGELTELPQPDERPVSEATASTEPTDEPSTPTVVPVDITSEPRGAYIYHASGGPHLGRTPKRIALPYGQEEFRLILRFPNGERAHLGVVPDRPRRAHGRPPSSDSQGSQEKN